MPALGAVNREGVGAPPMVLRRLIPASECAALVGVGEGGFHSKETNQVVVFVLEPTVHSEGRPRIMMILDPLVIAAGARPVGTAVSRG